MNNNGKRPGLLKVLLIYIAVFVIIAVVISAISNGSVFGGGGDVTEVEFSKFVEYLDKSQIAEVTVNDGNRSYNAILKSGQKIVTYAPSDSDMEAVSQ